jgi:hypothetical protein
MCRDWEFKIAYLESIVLFGVEPSTKQWEPSLKLRIQQRRERQEKIELEKKLRSLPFEQKKQLASQSGICWRCFSPLVPLMIDCVNCGAEN